VYHVARSVADVEAFLRMLGVPLGTRLYRLAKRFK
jgi:hypothetical protein